MKRIHTAVTAAFVLLMTGCAVPYQPAGANGGYSHKRLSNDTFVVTFEAPQAGFDEQRLRDYCLLRCAEVTKEYKFHYFTIEHDDHEISSEPIYVSGVSTTTGTSEEKKNGKIEYEETTQSSTHVLSKYETKITYEIKCYEEPPTRGNFATVFDAEATIEDIRYKYGILDQYGYSAGYE